MDKEGLINELTIGLADICSISIDNLKIKISAIVNDYSVKKMDVILPSINDGSTTLYLLKEFAKSKAIEGMNEKTFNLYKRTILELSELANKEVNLLGYDDINKYLLYCKQRGISASTIKNRRSLISSFYTFLYARDFIAKNPMIKVDKIKCNTKKEKALTQKDIERIKVLLEKKGDLCSIRLLAMIYFMLDTGVRVSELCSIKVSDVNWDMKSVNVLGKGNKYRDVYFSDASKIRIYEYFRLRGDVFQEDGNWNYNADTFLFSPKDCSTAISIRSVERSIKELGDELGISLHPHLFRRTFATNLADKNVPITIISDLMGHSKIDTTQIYISMTDETKKQYLSLLR